MALYALSEMAFGLRLDLLLPGLGIAISRQIVLSMGGDIAVKSEPGRGRDRDWTHQPAARALDISWPPAA